MRKNPSRAKHRRGGSDVAVLTVPVERRAWNPSVIFYGMGLAAIVVVLYWRVLGNQFVNFDDEIYVTANDHVKAGLTLDGFRWAFTNIENGNWHPITWLSHMLDVQWFGMDPGGHHFVSVLWHAANSAVLMALLWYMTGYLWRSILVGALFALHPLRVESVAWVSERKDVLSAFFCFCTLGAYAWYTRRPQSWRRYAAVAVFFSLALMAKPSVVSVPFLLLLLDYWPLGRKEPPLTLLREKIPFLAIAAAVSMATYLGQKQVGAMGNIEGLAFSERLANALVSYMRYLGKIVWPHPLAVIYPYQRNLPALSIAAACLLLAAVTALLLFRGRQFRYLPVAWFWFLGAMVPMIGLIQVGRQAYADRYTYIPSVGIFIGLVWIVADSIDGRKLNRGAAIVATSIILPTLALTTWSQIPYWHDDLTLFQHATDTTSENPMALYHVGDDLVEMGRDSEAIPYLEEMIRLQPNFVYVGYYTLGKAEARKGQTELALQNLSEAVRVKPDYPEAYYSRGITLLNSGNSQSAEPDLRAALQHGLSVEYSGNAHNGLGVILAQRDDVKGATEQFEQAVAIQPASVDAQRNLALALIHQDRIEEAIARLTQALSVTHNDPGLSQMLDDFRAQNQKR
jgi:tetratricopeptide (TPR) repeat protein